jgi:putative ABC transport system substrate-binding protein
MKTAGVPSILVAVLLLALGVTAEAQQPGKVLRTGFLSSGSPDAEKTRLAAFQQGLQDLEYLEGKNILIEQRYAGGKFDRLQAERMV